jgi:hypothetical protein
VSNPRSRVAQVAAFPGAITLTLGVLVALFIAYPGMAALALLAAGAAWIDASITGRKWDQ